VVLKLLELLDMVDKHLFHVCQWSSTVTTLYDKIQNFSNVSCLYVRMLVHMSIIKSRQYNEVFLFHTDQSKVQRCIIRSYEEQLMALSLPSQYHCCKRENVILIIKFSID